MIYDEELGPFREGVPLYEGGRRLDIPASKIVYVIRNIDCIKYHKEFTLFVKKYYDSITWNDDIILSVIRTLIAIEDISKSSLNCIIEDLANKYENIITGTPIVDLDIDITLNFIRCLSDYGRSVNLCISILISKVLSLKDNDEIYNSYVILTNHRDILIDLRRNEDTLCYGNALNSAINEVFVGIK